MPAFVFTIVLLIEGDFQSYNVTFIKLFFESELVLRIFPGDVVEQ